MKLFGKNIREWSLAVKLPLTFAVLVYLVVLAAGIALALQDIKRERLSLERMATQLVQAISLQNKENLIRHDYWRMYISLKRNIQQFQSPENSFLFGVILDSDGRVFSHTDPEHHRLGEKITSKVAFSFFSEHIQQTRVVYTDISEDKVLLVGSPILIGNKAMASVWLAYDTAYVNAHVWSRGIFLALLATLLALLAGCAGWLISRRMISPLGDITKGVARVKSGEIEDVEPIDIKEMDEIGRLAEIFNSFVEELKEKKNLEEQLQLQKRLATVGRMVAGVAHEINNPLGGMKNALENMKVFGGDAGKCKENMQLLSMGISHIEGVVQALLAGGKPLEIEICEPRCFDDLYLLIRADCFANGIHISWENLLETAFYGPCSALRQIMINLLVNAIKAMPEGGELSVSICLDGDQLVFRVVDTGVGISSEQMEKIFEPFSTFRKNGVGLGLWVCLQHVHAMNGQLLVSSQEGKGSEFVLKVPVTETSKGEMHAAYSHMSD